MAEFLVQYLVGFCSRLETISDVISGSLVRPMVADIRVKLHDSNLNRSREILPEAVGGGKFDGFFAITSDWK